MKRVGVIGCLVLVFVFQTLFAPVQAGFAPFGVMAADGRSAATVGFNTEGNSSRGSVVMPPQLRAGGELTVLLTTRGNPEDWTLLGTPGVRLLSRGWSAADIPSLGEVPAEPGRVNVEFRVCVDAPVSARLVLENVQQSGQRFEVTSKPGIGAESLEGLATLTLDSITPPAPRVGVRKPVVLLVDFADRSPAPASTVSYFQDLLFAPTGGRSSMRDYFNDVSYGQLQVAGHVYGGGGAAWIRLPRTFAYYDSWSDTNSCPHLSEFLEDVRAAADPLVDFSQHDGDGDGIVDGVIIVYAGEQARWWSKGLWPHAGWINWMVDGVTTDRYTVQAEGAIDISVFCHEYSHALGAWDFYDYDSLGEGDGPSCGAGIWTLMAWSDRQLLDPFHRYYMGWVAPTTIDAAGTYTVAPAEGPTRASTVFRVNLHAPDEYLLIENRQQIGWDTFLPGSGLVIWHIDEGVTTGNRNQWYPGHTSGGHCLAAVEQADGLWELERSVNGGNAGDVYQPGGSLTPLTTPTSSSYDGSGPQYAIDEIALAGSSISFNLSVAGGSAVSLTEPANGAITPTVTPTLSWQPYAGATSYRVRVASDARLSTVLVDINTGSSTSFAVPSGILELSTQCFWRVSALAGEEVIVDSAIWSFTTCGDAFEPDRALDPLDWTLAALIETDGALQHHNFDRANDEDYVKFLALSGVTYTIDILNVEERVTTQFMLLAPDGATILDRSDFAQSRIDFECPAGKGGTYYIRVFHEMIMGDGGILTGYDLRVQPALSVALFNVDNAGTDYGLTGVTNHITATVTRNGVPVADACVDVNSGATVLATDASGQVSFVLQHDNTTCDLLQVTSDNSKVTAASFWTIEPSDALVSVKPKDANGYYLTRFYVDTYDLVGHSQWGTSYSGTSNSLTLPSHASASNLAVVTACGENHGGKFTENKVGTGYVFTLNPTLTAGEKTALAPLATTDCVPLFLTVSLDGQPLVDGAYVYLRNEAYDYVTTSAGGYIFCVPYTPADPWWDETVVVYVTPGTYTAVAVQNIYYMPSVWLTQSGISALFPTTAAIAATTSQLGTLACRGMDGHDRYARYNYLYLSSAGVECSLLTTQALESRILLSPGAYKEKRDEIYYEYPAGPSGPFDYWRYTLEASATRTVIAGSVEPVTFGGRLTTTIDTPASVAPGQSVTTKVTFRDPEGHRLVDVEGYAWSSSPTISPELLEKSDCAPSSGKPSLATLDHRSDTLLPAEAQGYVYPAPHFLVKDATNSTKVDIQGISLDSAYGPGYLWTVPADAAAGTWYASVTFDPGVFQDPISTDQPFAVAGMASFTLTTTASPSTGGTISRSPNQSSYAYDTLVTLTATPSPGYAFTGWSGDLTGTTNPTTVTMDADKTVAANFTPIGYGEPKSTHTWLDYPAGTTNVQSYDVDVCIDAFPATPDPAWLYYFAIQTNFSDGGGGAHGGLQWASGGQKANWGGYDLRYAGDMQSIVVDQPWATGTWYRYHVARGAQQPDGTWAWSFSITNLSTNTPHYLGEIYSKGSSISGCVVWMETGYGVVATTPRAQVRWRNPVYTYGALQATGHPIAGYATYNGTCIEPHTTDQQLISTGPREWIQLTNAAVRVTPANTYLWKDEAFTLTTTSSPSAGGTITKSPDQSSYTYDTIVTLTASANPGYLFTGWSGDLTGTTNPVTITMDADKTVTATFVPAAGTATLALSPLTVAPGSTVTVPLTIAITSGNVAVIQLTVTSSDPTHVALSNITAGDLGGTYTVNPATGIIGWMDLTGITGTHTIANLAFTGIGATGTSATISIGVGSGDTIGDSTARALSWSPITAAATVSATKPGDVDGDGTVTMLDALLAARAAVGIETLTPTQQVAADVDNNGTINMLDVLIIARMAVGLPG